MFGFILTETMSSEVKNKITGLRVKTCLMVKTLK